jgi:hypothetical protein
MKSYCQQDRFAPAKAGRLLFVVLLVLSASLSTALATHNVDSRGALPQKPPKCERQLDSLWIVSTRHLCCPDQCPVDDVELHVKQCQGESGWEDSNLEALFEASKDTITVIHIPGNRADWDTAIQEGKAVRDTLAQACPPQPITFVIWSWPADQIKGQIRDFRAKANRANCDGVYLAWFLARLEKMQANGETKVSLIGYSYGARIALGGLHVWSGGGLVGVRLPDSDIASDTTVRVVLVAAAEHNYWLQPDCLHGLAYGRIDYALNLHNSCDQVLKRYRIVERCGRPQALGYTGLVGRSCFEDNAERFHEYDVCCAVGKSHDIAYYLFDDAIADKLTRYALWNEVDQ